MRNPFAKPQTPGEWLLGSVCWTVMYVGGWWLLNYYLLTRWQVSGGLANFLYCASSGLGSRMLWLLALRDKRTFLGSSEAASLGIVSSIGVVLWLFLLLLIIVAGLLVITLYVCLLVAGTLLDLSI